MRLRGPFGVGLYILGEGFVEKVGGIFWSARKEAGERGSAKKGPDRGKASQSKLGLIGLDRASVAVLEGTMYSGAPKFSRRGNLEDRSRNREKAGRGHAVPSLSSTRPPILARSKGGQNDGEKRSVCYFLSSAQSTSPFVCDSFQRRKTPGKTGRSARSRRHSLTRAGTGRTRARLETKGEIDGRDKVDDNKKKSSPHHLLFSPPSPPPSQSHLARGRRSFNDRHAGVGKETGN